MRKPLQIPFFVEMHHSYSNEINTGLDKSGHIHYFYLRKHFIKTQGLDLSKIKINVKTWPASDGKFVEKTIRFCKLSFV